MVESNLLSFWGARATRYSFLRIPLNTTPLFFKGPAGATATFYIPLNGSFCVHKAFQNGVHKSVPSAGDVVHTYLQVLRPPRYPMPDCRDSRSRRLTPARSTPGTLFGNSIYWHVIISINYFSQAESSAPCSGLCLFIYVPAYVCTWRVSSISVSETKKKATRLLYVRLPCIRMWSFSHRNTSLLPIPPTPLTQKPIKTNPAALFPPPHQHQGSGGSHTHP